MKMIEKVAKALVKAGLPLMVDELKLAKASIAAMKEPTDEMIKGGKFADTELLIEGYQAMIDAALKE